MSRTTKDDKKRGPLALGKGHKQRAIGYEFWSGRGDLPCPLPGRRTKKRTHKRERARNKKETKEDP
jgi:hypothetical protein